MKPNQAQSVSVTITWRESKALCATDEKKDDCKGTSKPGSGNGPSSATLSRARVKLDMLAMFCRQYEWKREGFDNTVVTLCF